jgi:hypothetical protein
MAARGKAISQTPNPPPLKYAPLRARDNERVHRPTGGLPNESHEMDEDQRRDERPNIIM